MIEPRLIFRPYKGKVDPEMASKTLLYNVSEPVGKGCPNLADDVLLVRFFLRRISQAPDVKGPYFDMPLVPTYDPQLSNAILWFQKAVAAAHAPVTADGRVDPSPNGQGWYTIRHLNFSYRKRFPQYGHLIENDPVFPGALRAPLAMANV